MHSKKCTFIIHTYDSALALHEGCFERYALAHVDPDHVAEAEAEIDSPVKDSVGGTSPVWRKQVRNQTDPDGAARGLSGKRVKCLAVQDVHAMSLPSRHRHPKQDQLPVLCGCSRQ